MNKFDHYIALDWAQSNMALAHSDKSEGVQTIDVRSDIKALKNYIDQMKGTKILTFEETSPAQWLYTELLEHVDQIIVCEPYTNHLLKSGPKTDRIDAIKLLKLLKADMLKPVFHCTDEFVNTRKIVSAHADLVWSLVQAKNRYKAMYRAKGMKKGAAFTTREEQFVERQLKALIETHEKIRSEYENEFERICSENEMVRNLTTIPGIGKIGATRIAAAVIEPKRFSHKTGFWLYCGLQKYDLISGGRSYGKRSPRYSRQLKSTFKTAAVVATRDNFPNVFKEYFDQMRKDGVSDKVAKHNVARRIAAIALGVMRTGKQLDLSKINKAC